jgi:ABC-type bacteriocin/lantibiotic exporter with double-glycine peptidase domain
MKLYLQQDKMDCGPTCLRIVAAHYGRSFSLQKLRNLAGFSIEGVSLLGIASYYILLSIKRFKIYPTQLGQLTKWFYLIKLKVEC